MDQMRFILLMILTLPYGKDAFNEKERASET